jgi:hypothetical protein
MPLNLVRHDVSTSPTVPVSLIHFDSNSEAENWSSQITTFSLASAQSGAAPDCEKWPTTLSSGGPLGVGDCTHC